MANRYAATRASTDVNEITKTAAAVAALRRAGPQEFGAEQLKATSAFPRGLSSFQPSVLPILYDSSEFIIFLRWHFTYTCSIYKRVISYQVRIKFLQSCLL